MLLYPPWQCIKNFDLKSIWFIDWFISFKGIFSDPDIDSFLCSFWLLTSRIELFDLFSRSLRRDASEESIDEVVLFADCQFSIPPFRYPSVWSKPTLANLVITSSSLPFGTTNKRGVLISSRISPTHGANLPSNPIKIELGICALAKSSWCLTSRTIAFLFVINSSNLTGSVSYTHLTIQTILLE